jgi:hypothetical protein
MRTPISGKLTAIALVRKMSDELVGERRIKYQKLQVQENTKKNKETGGVESRNNQENDINGEM